MQKGELQGIPLVLVSIGVPEKAQALIQHLALERYGTQHALYVDPENVLYDALDLNRGIQRTFFNPATPYSFLQRLQEPSGMQDLGYILSKWTQGTSVRLAVLQQKPIQKY